MPKYHINPKTGQPNICRAEKRACPVGGAHYDDKKTARAGYEKQMEERMRDAREGSVPQDLAKPEIDILAKRAALDLNWAENLVSQRQSEISRINSALDEFDPQVAQENIQEKVNTYQERLNENSFFNDAYEQLKKQNELKEKSDKNYSKWERTQLKAVQILDFGMLGAAGGSGAGAIIAANAGRPGMAALLGAAAVATSAPQWINHVQTAMRKRELLKKQEKYVKDNQDLLESLKDRYIEAQDKLETAQAERLVAENTLNKIKDRQLNTEQSS